MSLMLLIGSQSNDSVDPSDCTVIEDPKWYVQPALVSVEIKDVGYITGVLIKDTNYIITSANNIAEKISSNSELSVHFYGGFVSEGLNAKVYPSANIGIIETQIPSSLTGIITKGSTPIPNESAITGSYVFNGPYSTINASYQSSRSNLTGIDTHVFSSQTAISEDINGGSVFDLCGQLIGIVTGATAGDDPTIIVSELNPELLNEIENKYSTLKTYYEKPDLKKDTTTSNSIISSTSNSFITTTETASNTETVAVPTPTKAPTATPTPKPETTSTPVSTKPTAKPAKSNLFL